MSLSPEAIISIVGVLINLPPALMILWTVFKRKRARHCDTSGRHCAHLPHVINDPNFPLVEAAPESDQPRRSGLRKPRRSSTTSRIVGFAQLWLPNLVNQPPPSHTQPPHQPPHPAISRWNTEQNKAGSQGKRCI
jgi:hypothetical protein